MSNNELKQSPYIELVSLYNFRGWIINVVMSLVVFVPLKPGVDTVEEAWLTRAILVRPQELLVLRGNFYAEGRLIIIHSLSSLLFKFCLPIKLKNINNYYYVIKSLLIKFLLVLFLFFKKLIHQPSELINSSMTHKVFLYVYCLKA